MSEERSFLSRWSRRKRAAAGGGAPRPTPPVTAAPLPPEGAPPEAAPTIDRPAFDPASLPPVEELTAESDFAAFLREEVPAALRRAALRRAWTLDPAIRDFVGPAEYAWDYNAPGGVPGFSFELTGDLDRLLAQAVGAAEEAPEAEAPAEAPASGDAPGNVEAAAPATEAAPAESVPLVAAEAPEPVSAEAAPGEPVPPPAAAPAAAPKRRHGGALPT